jgi:DNA-3-methyladenine glycosylase
MQHHLQRSFFARDTHTVARELLGKVLVRTWRGKELTARITEVESYVGENDKACHASRGRTARTEVMFGEAGHAYVYLIYGVHHCLNIVTEQKDFPAAVLIRSVDAAIGPGRVTKHLHITRALNMEDLVQSEKLYVVDDGCYVRVRDIKTAPRIGVDYAGEDALLSWRYFVEM